LNEKRNHLLDLEASYGISIFIVPSDDIKGSQAQIERAGERAVPQRKTAVAPVKIDTAFQESEEEPETEEIEQAQGAEEGEAERAEAAEPQDNGDSSRRRRRRRGRRGGRRGQDRDQTQAGFNGGERDDVPGLGDQPNLEPRSEPVDSGEDEAASEPVEVVATDGGDEPSDQEGRPERERGRGRRDRWGRGRRNRNRHERGGNGENAEHSPAAEAAPRREERHDERREERRESRFEAAPTPKPAEKPKSEPLPDPAAAYQPPKWQPPAPTTIERPAQAKTGWWSKRG
jgi:ribonuclease E